MQYFISFLEGIITFVSPCLLPMLPLYVSYFAGGRKKENRRVLKNALGFILGFTALFVSMGALAGSFGRLVREYKTILDLVTGLVVVIFGLNYLGLFEIRLFRGASFQRTENLGFFSSLLFGAVFAVGWTPCVGAFLGSALMMAANGGKVLEGTLMLFSYSLGLGIPFLFCALLVDRLKGAFSFIKRHYGVITKVSGLFLVLMGVLMATGLFGKFLTVLS